jgi:microcystin-dependent protein
MSEPFLGEIHIFGFNFAPRGYATCDGQLLPISQNQSLYSLLGTTYGGDGRTTFGLPDLRGRAPIHKDTNSGISLGQRWGEERHALTEQEMPAHTHGVQASNLPANRESPAGSVWTASPDNPYTPATPDQSLAAACIANAGANVGHENMQPFLVINFCIALQGVFPSRN